MELEVKEKTGAGFYERDEDRVTYRNGYRERQLDTRVGSVSLEIPRLREGSYFPSLLEPRRKVEQAKRLKELEKENSQLKKLVADITLDNAILKEAAGETSEPVAEAQDRKSRLPCSCRL
jgi:transposase-like protein